VFVISSRSVVILRRQLGGKDVVTSRGSGDLFIAAASGIGSHEPHAVRRAPAALAEVRSAPRITAFLAAVRDASARAPEADPRRVDQHRQGLAP
jgi:hypothetical protein